MSRERLAAGAVHYAAGCRRRMSHGSRVVVTATARSGVPSHGATPRGRQLSARIISLLKRLHPTLSCEGEGGGGGTLNT